MAHRHRAKTRETRGYMGTVRAPVEENRAAHGGVTHVDTCACGARRETNSNGRFVERGQWVVLERWVTWGRVRGMGPICNTRAEAERSARADAVGCSRQGGYSDRHVFRVDDDGFLIDDHGENVWPPHGRSTGAVRVR